MNQVAKIDEQSGEVVSAADAMINMIERVATNPDADVDKMERLIKMKLDLMDRDAEQAFNAAMVAAQGEIPVVVRDKTNDQTRSKYGTLEAIMKVAGPVISKHGFAPSFGTGESPIEGHYRVTCDLMHKAGHKSNYHADIPADMTGLKGNQNKTATHGFGSSMSYGQRYLLKLIFNITLTDEDDDGNRSGSQAITEEQEAIISAKMKEVGMVKEKFLRAYKIQSIADLPASKFNEAMIRFNDFAKAKAAAK